jgi:hypothetical protein
VLGSSALTITLVALGLVLSGSVASAQVPGRSIGNTLFPELPARGPVVVYPYLLLGVEYNDNIFLSNAQKKSDFIGTVTPGIQVVLESTTYRWSAGGSVTGEKYLDHDELDSTVQRYSFFVNGSHRLAPRFTLTLNEFFVEDKNTNLVGTDTAVIAVGRRNARSNSFAPGFLWGFAPKTSLKVEAGYSLQRYDDPLAADSDIYRITTDILHEFSPRFTGIVGYEGRYLDVERQLGVTTHTLRLGASYRFTPFTTGTIVLGPTVRMTKHESPKLSPFVDAQLTTLFGWGSATAFASHSVGTAGGVGGTTENTSVGALLQVTSLVRDLVIEVGPRYSMSRSAGGGDAIDVRSITLDARVAYRFTSWFAGVAGYRFFQQRSDSTGTTLAGDIDQNRVYVGAQFGYPFKFE